ncbi:MAG: rhodanese-like domain-containing protein [Verrucomicrobiota bacterium]
MPWLILAFMAVLLAGWWITRLDAVSPQQAKALLRAGAVVIDVRTAHEFSSRALPEVINIPLSEVRQRIAEVVPDLRTPVLLHCQSGGRSGIACKMLRSMGYQRVGNLGSLGRAESILGLRSP